MAQFSFRVPNADYLGFPATTEAILESACRAEELGFDAVLVNDHIIVDSTPGVVESWGNTYDPLMVLSFVAARTSRIRLGVSVLIMPYRNPIATAKMFATLDQLSGGRAIAGVGAGWNVAEFNALGVPFNERGARTTEYLQIWRSCWAPGTTTFCGQFFAFEDMHINPKPVQQPHLPIWVGGSSRPALRRAAEFAQVWQPTPTPLADLIKNQTYLRDACAKIGRQDIPDTRMSFRVNFSVITGSTLPVGGRPLGHGTAEQIAGDIKQFQREAGVDAFQINFNGCHNLQQLFDSMDTFMSEGKPAVDQETSS